MNISVRTFSQNLPTAKLFKLSIIGLSIGMAAAVWADDEKSEAKSSASSSAESSSKKSSNSKIEVKVIEERDATDSDKAPKRSSTHSFSVQGNRAESVEKAIDEIEKKLSESKLPKHLLDQVMEALRSKSSVHGQATVIIKKGKEDEPQFYTFQYPNFMPDFVSPNVKSSLSKAIEQAIDEEKLEPEVAQRLNRKLQSAIEKIGKFPGAPTSQYRLGIQLGSIEKRSQAEEKEEPGINVDAVFEDSPAAQAGVKAGDRIISANGVTIHAPEELVEMVQAAGENDKSIELIIVSDGTEKTLSIKPNQTPAVDFRMPQLNGLNPQAWLVHPQGWNGMVPGGPNSQWQVTPQHEKDLNSFRERLEATLEAGRTKQKEYMNKWAEAKERAEKEAMSKPGKNAKSSKGELQQEKAETDKVNLEKLKELEEEVAEIKSMLKQLIEKK